MVKELKATSLRLNCDPTQFDFETTDDLAPLDRIIGQERAIEALKLGLGIQDSKNRYNIYVAGSPGTGKMSAVKYFLDRMSKDAAKPPDLCYVHNFKEPYNPRYLELPAGRGVQLREDMERLITRLKRDIPKVFESDEFKARSKKINERYTERRSKLYEEMEKKSRGLGFAIQRTPIGINTLPLRKEGEPLSQEEYEALSEEERAEIRGKQGEVQSLVQESVQEINRVEEEREREIKQLSKEAVLFMIEPQFSQLKDRYEKIEKVVAFLEEAKNDIVDNIEHFEQKEGQSNKKAPLSLLVQQQDPFKRYHVNVLVDNSQTEGAPVIVEENASYTNLFGLVERRVQMGIAVTDFTMIKPGSLHRANGGYLVLNADNLFRRGISWEALKIAIKRREIRIEDPLQMLGYTTTEGQKPEPIPFRIKIIIIGNPRIYELLHYYDEDFPKLFSVRSDFGTEMERTPAHEQEIGRFLRARCGEDPGLLPFDRTGVAKLVEYSAELAGDQKKLSAEFGNLTSIAKEASYWAREEEESNVADRHIMLALEKRDDRRNRIEEKIHEMIARDQILVDTEGDATGQVNGLAILRTGDFTFGKPSRITATVHTGKDGIVDIEREAKLGGETHTKGIMILKGFLGEWFAENRPLSLSASIAFEQSYSKIDGDSASSTELYALLSSLSGLPIKQGIAVTGSVNQKGEVQTIGGVNEKIEGFFKVCEEKGINGAQGVLIPAKNIDNLMLSEEVVKAVQEGKFHIYPVSNIAEGIEILTGVPAGKRGEDGGFPEGTVFARVAERLDRIRAALKEEGEEKEEE
ncbi:MAG: AAA family ATPase [Candidatus Bipolaricaulota bacterium]|nr:AAA family ATPase [Candidatus Bipolaricaulota bacterium]